MDTTLRPSQAIPHDILEKHLLPDLMVNHSLNTPVFIIGQPRSGTSIFARMFRKYLKVNFGPESQFFVRTHRELAKFGDLNTDENCMALINQIAGERCFKRNQFAFEVEPDRVFSELPERSYEAIIATVLRHFAEHNGMGRWGDKTPEYIEDLDLLRKLFPDAQYIHIIRDGRDVALSHFSTHFGAKNSVVAALEWQRNVERVRHFALRIPDNQFTEIRYEDLMDAPEQVFRHLIQFLGIQDPHDDLGRFIEGEIDKEFKKQNYYKWKKGFSNRAKRDYERVARSGLAHYGYEVVTAKKPSPMTSLEKVFWKVAHLVKKATNLGYWKDNLYKSMLRSRKVRMAR